MKPKGPIHYSALAEHLGVSKITAYDMLRHLEEKGYISSHYQLEDEKTGPGRSKVVFSPHRISPLNAHPNGRSIGGRGLGESKTNDH